MNQLATILSRSNEECESLCFDMKDEEKDTRKDKLFEDIILLYLSRSAVKSVDDLEMALLIFMFSIPALIFVAMILTHYRVI